MINKLEDSEDRLNTFRPLIQSCSSLLLSSRPTAEQVKTEILRISSRLFGGGQKSLAERMLVRLAKYSEDLECEVEKRNNILIDEIAKCDALLAQFLPRFVTAPSCSC